MTYKASTADSISAAEPRQRLLASMTRIPTRGMNHSRSLSTSPTRMPSPIRPISATFDGRCTIARPKRLLTPSRTRRTEFPTGASPGKDTMGTAIQDRIAEKNLFLKPARNLAYVNDSRRGSIRFAVYETAGLVSAPTSASFSRCADARGCGGVWTRSIAGCVPYRP